MRVQVPDIRPELRCICGRHFRAHVAVDAFAVVCPYCLRVVGVWDGRVVHLVADLAAA